MGILIVNKNHKSYKSHKSHNGHKSHKSHKSHDRTEKLKLKLNKNNYNIKNPKKMDKVTISNQIENLIKKNFYFTEKCPDTITYEMLTETITPKYYDKKEFNREFLWKTYYDIMNLKLYNKDPSVIILNDFK